MAAGGEQVKQTVAMIRVGVKVVPAEMKGRNLSQGVLRTYGINRT